PSLNVKVSDECVTTFTDLKLCKIYKYILYKFSEDKNNFSIDKAVETISNNKSSYIENYKNFCSEIISKNEPYFAIYDFEYEKLNEGHRNKIILISWVSKNADAQNKFLSAANDSDDLLNENENKKMFMASIIDAYENEYVFTEPLKSFYSKIPENDLKDQFSKNSQKMIEELKKKIKFFIETFHSSNDINFNYLCEPLRIVFNAYIDAGLLKLKNQPKSVQIIISAIEASNNYINYILSTWKNLSDYYSEKKAIQQIQKEDGENTEKLKYKEVIDLLNEDQSANISDVIKEFKSQSNRISVFKSVKEATNILAFKIFNEVGSLPKVIAKKNTIQRIQEYLKSSLYLFIYCSTFGLVFSVGNPLGGNKEWKSLNEDNFEKTVNILKENEALKSALEETNQIYGPKIISSLIKYANELKLKIDDLSYLRRISANLDDNFKIVDPKITPIKYNFYDQFEQFSIYDLDKRYNQEETNKPFNDLMNYDYMKNDVTRYEPEGNIVTDEVISDINESVESYTINNKETSFGSTPFDAFLNKKKRLKNKLNKNLTGTTDLTDYSQLLNDLKNDLKDGQFGKFQFQIEKLLLSIKTVKGTNDNALQPLNKQILDFSSNLFIHFSEDWYKNINNGLFTNTIKFFDDNIGNNIQWYSEFRKIIDSDIATSYNYLHELKLRSIIDYDNNQYKTISKIIDDFELEFSKSDQLSKVVIISNHAMSINRKADKFLKVYSDYFINYLQKLPVSYQEEKNEIQRFVQEYFNSEDKLILFINMPEKSLYYENLVKNKIVKLN
ncbi:26449_t:CDS:2, partial [Racocetra persica]